LLQVKELTIHTRAGAGLLSDVSFHIEPGELISLTGTSRSGKSTLLESLAGLLKPASGEILIDGIDLYAHLKAFRASIGYVPAEFALQPNLTVAEVMREGARIRLPRRTSHEERELRVQSLMELLGLTQAADLRVGALSRADRRRLSIALELIPAPGLLLLDQAVERLTPFEEVQITILLRDLARQGLTIIQADQRARSAGLSDKVIILGPGGVLAWFGPPEEGFAHLRTLVPRGVAKDLFGLKEAIELLANPQVEDGLEWANRFKEHDAYQKYVDDPLHNRYPDLLLQTRPLLRLRLRNSSQEKLPPPIVPRANAAQKFFLLIRRNARLLWRDRTLFHMLAIPPLVALIDFLLTSTTALDPGRLPISLGMLVFLVLLTSGMLVQTEIFKERAVYQRENRTGSLPLPYILSKVWLAGWLALYQGLVWAAIHFIATGMAGGVQAFGLYGITFFLLAFVGGLLGLLVSALSRSATTITGWLLLLTVPQLLLSGSVLPLEQLRFPFDLLARINPSRYAYEALLAASGTARGPGIAPAAGHWGALAILSISLIVLLLVIQQGAERRSA
jgi:ABC-type multidrug transport system ATPase subunit